MIHESTRSPTLWRRVEELVDAAPDVAALRAHRIDLAAARIWSSRGVGTPPELRSNQQHAAIVNMGAPRLLERVRAAYDGRILVMKGPEVAAWYEHPSDRDFRDVDLLVDDAPAAQRALIAAGFVEIGHPDEYKDEQHMCPLIAPGIPLVLEVHRRPNIPAWLPPVKASQILDLGVPSATGVAGILAPSAGAHALLLAAHSFSHSAMGRIRDVVDVAAVAAGDAADDPEAVAREWGWEHMWQLSHGAVLALVEGGDVPRSLRLLGGHLFTARERTVLENHVAHAAAPVYALPKRRVPVAMTGVMLDTVSRRKHESWSRKLRRSCLALAHARMSTSSHEQTLP